MNRFKSWVFLNLILPLFKGHIEAIKVDSKMYILERSLKQLPIDERDATLKVIKNHLVKDIAEFIVHEGLVNITEQRDTYTGQRIVKATIVVYRH